MWIFYALLKKKLNYKIEKSKSLKKNKTIEDRKLCKSLDELCYS